MINRDLLIPTSGSTKRLDPLLASISSQTVSPDGIVFLIHGSLDNLELNKIESRIKLSLPSSIPLQILHHKNASYTPGQGTGFDRNFLIEQSQNDHLFMIDDDNVFQEDFFEKSIQEYSGLVADDDSSPLLWSPTIMRRDSGSIQSAGIAGFRRWMPAYSYAVAGSTTSITMIGANSLLGSRELFQSIGFDPLFQTTLEDIDFSYRVGLSGGQIVVSDTVYIQHMEADKSLMQKKFLGSPAQAYERSKNRVFFAKKNATPWQKIQYFGLGLWAQTFWFLLLTVFHSKNNKIPTIKAIISGTFSGLGK